jgi:hypothetical protein
MLICISIERTQPLAGAAVTEGGEPVPFDGWLDLLRVVSELVAAAGGEDVQVMERPNGNEPGS